MKLTQLVNEQTGEIFVPLREVEEGYKAKERQRQGYKEKLQREQAQVRDDHRQFLKVNNKRMSELNTELTLVDAGLLFKLSLNLRLGCGEMLVKGNDKRPLKKVELGSIIGRTSKSGIDTALKRLIQLGVIRKEGRKYFISEDLVSMRESKGKEPFTKVYRKQAKDMLDMLTDSEAGLILKCTAYVSHNFLILAENPTEQDDDKVKPLRQEELAKLLGVEEGYLSTLLSNLRKKGVIATFKTGSKDNTILLHPFLCDRGNGEEQVVKFVTKFFKIAQN